MQISKLNLLAFLLTSSIVISGCASMDQNNDKIYGSWQLVSLQKGNNTVSVTGPDTNASQETFTLNLSSEGKASGKVACNRWHSSFAISDGKLELPKAATTRKRCFVKNEHLQPLEGRYLSTLDGASILKVSEASLQLAVSPEETWHFAPYQK